MGKAIIITEEQYNRLLLDEQLRIPDVESWKDGLTQRQIDVIKLLQSEYSKHYESWYGEVKQDLQKNNKLLPHTMGGPDPRNKPIIEKELVKRFFNPKIASKLKATYRGKEMTVLEALNRIVLSKSQSKTVDQQMDKDLVKYQGNPITWRPEGFSDADFATELQKKFDAVSGCEWRSTPDGGGCYYCPGKTSGWPCGKTPRDAVEGPTGIVIPSLLPNTGNHLSYLSVGKFNDALRHKKNVSLLYGWSSVEDLIADEEFFSSDDWVDRMKNIDPNILINPQYIATMYSYFYTQLKEDTETKKLITLWDKKKKQEQEKAAIEVQKKQDEIVAQGVDYYKQQSLLSLQTIPGLSSLDHQGGGGAYVPDIIKQSEIQNIKFDSRQLSILEDKLRDIEHTINIINLHNDQIFSQTIQKFNKVGCNKKTYVTYYLNPATGEVVLPKSTPLTHYKQVKKERPSIQQACIKNGGKNGVWVSPGSNANRYGCNCMDDYAKQQKSTDGLGSWSPNTLSKYKDIRSVFERLDDEFTYHDLLQIGAVVAYFIPGGVIVSVALELIDGIGYFTEGDNLDGSIAIVFAALPAIGPLVRKIGVTGVKRIRQILSAADKMESSVEKMDYITKSYKKLDTIEQETLTKILSNPDGIKEEVKELSKLAKNNKPEFKKRMLKSNPKLEKHLHSWAKNSKFGEASAMEKVIYAGAVGATLGSDAEIKEKGSEDIIKDLASNTKTIKSKKEGEPYFDVDAVRVDGKKVNVAKYNAVINPVDDSKKNIESSTVNAIQKYKQSLIKK